MNTSLLTQHTGVKFQFGDTIAESAIILFEEVPDTPNKFFLITKETPFYPVNYRWPDQPSDIGKIEIDSTILNVINAKMVAVNKNEGTLKFGENISIPRGDEDNWIMLVAHIIEKTSDINPTNFVGRVAKLFVDEGRRFSLSIPHTASHLMALAINKALSTFWKKETDKDSLGNPDFDKIAITESSIEPYISKDKYRLGKSIKKKGFDIQTFEDNISEIENNVNLYVTNWINTNSTISVECDENYISSMRWWVTEIDGKPVKMACGGTHPKTLSSIKNISIKLNYSKDDGLLFITTKASA